MNSAQRPGGISRAVAQSRKAIGGLLERFRGRGTGATFSAKGKARDLVGGYHPRFQGEQVILGWPFPNVPITIPDSFSTRREQ